MASRPVNPERALEGLVPIKATRFHTTVDDINPALRSHNKEYTIIPIVWGPSGTHRPLSSSSLLVYI